MNVAQEVATRLDAVTRQALDERRIVGSVVMVAKNGQIIYQQPAGYANREEGLPMSEEAIFLLSSVTKPIVTAAALCLVERGEIALNESVTRYLADFKPTRENGRAPDITLHQLLTHTAGLSYRFFEPHGKGPYNSLNISDGFDEITVSLADNLSRLAQAPLLFEPGQGWMYSLSMDVLGAVISAATGRTLPDLVASLITKPLGMSSSGFTVCSPERLVKHYYDAAPQPAAMGQYCQLSLPEEWNSGILRYAPERLFSKCAYPSGGAGMAGSAPDFMRFLLALSADRNNALPDRLITRMNRPYVNSEYQTQGPGWGFGYGGAVLDDPQLANSPQGKGTLQWGGVYGHNWFYDPVNELAVVAFTNVGVEGMSGLYPTQIRDAVYGV